MSARPERPGSGGIFDLITLGEIDGSSAWYSCEAESSRCSAGEIIVLRVAGEVDLCTLPSLRVALDDSLQRRPAHLVIDLSAMTFCSVRGLNLLTQTGHTAAQKATGYAISGVSPHLDRVWTLGWDGDIPVRYRSTAAAMIALSGLPDNHCRPV